MGLFDHLFKSKSPPSEETNVEAGARTADPAKPSESAARTPPPHRADPSAFLHPKSFVPRGATPLTPPGKPGATGPASGVRKPGAPAAPATPEEIVLTLGDVLSRIPSPYLKAGQHDPKRELRFSINDLSSDIARGRAAVPLSRIAQLMPDIFVKQISRDEDTEVRLPLQKLVEQIGLLRSRPAAGSGDRVVRPTTLPAVVEAIRPLPDPEIRQEPVGVPAQTLEPARESVRDLLAPPEPIIELKPAVTVAAPMTIVPEPAPEVKPVAEESAPAPAAAPEIPAPDAPVAKAPDALVPSEPPVAAEPAPDLVEEVAVPAVAESSSEAPAKAEAEPEEAAPTPVAELAPPPLEASETPAAEVLPPLPSEPLFPMSRVAPAKPEALEPVEAEVGGERIQLSLAAILRGCPPEIIVGERPHVPDNIRITLPFAPIDRQLVTGQVEISALRFVAALPVAYQKHFSARIGVKVPIPLEEVFQNLPNPAAKAPGASGPAAQILAPAPGAPIEPPPTENAQVPPIPAPDFVSLGGEQPTPLTGASLDLAPDAAAPEALPEEAPPVAALPPLDLPAFHLFAPPPPVIGPDPTAPEVVTTIVPPPVPENVGIPAPVSAPEPAERVGEVISPDAPVGDSSPALEPTQTAAPEADLPAPPPVFPWTPESEAPVGEEPELPALDAQPAALREAPVEAALPVPPVVKKPSEPVFEGNSAAVFAEANQTIPPPQMFRPFIVLPPPIFGFTPTPANGESATPIKLQCNTREDIAPEFTDEKESDLGVATDMEADALVPMVDRSDELPEPVTAPDAGIDRGGEDGPAAALPGIISIDFTQALVPHDEPALANASRLAGVTEIPPLAPAEPALVEPSPLVEVIEVQATAPLEPAFSNAPSLVEVAEVMPPPPVEPEPAPSPATDEPPVLSEVLAPESISIPAVAVAPSLVAAEEPVPDVGPAPAGLPIEKPPAAIVFMAEGRFADHPPKIVPDLEPEPEADPEPASTAPERPAAEPEPAPPVQAAPEIAPLLHLPRIIQSFAQSDVLPPPGLPLRRFDQDALQALFMTDETLDLPRISRLAAQLPGVHACVIASRDQACTGGELPAGFDLAALLGLAPRVGEAAGRMPIGSLKHFTLYGEQYAVSFFERNGFSLCAVHRPRSFVPGVREKLVAIADELSKA